MSYLIANWQAPVNISAVTTKRTEGFSLPPFDKYNLGFHVGDQADHVTANRNHLISELNLPKTPEWLEQTHSTHCVIVDEDSNRNADAAITRSPGCVLAIMTADCLPIMLCNKQGNEIAAIHAGWRGLVNGIIDNTLIKMQSKAQELVAWIGPAICQSCYETGQEVFDIFAERYPCTRDSFQAKAEKWQADLPRMAEQILYQHGIHQVFQSNICTFEQKNDFYSYRRASQTGRMATLVWFNKK